MGGTATRVSTNNDSRVIKQIPYAPAIAESLSEITRPLPIIPNFTEWSDAIGTELHKALVGQTTISKALSTADSISNEMMKEIGYQK